MKNIFFLLILLYASGCSNNKGKEQLVLVDKTFVLEDNITSIDEFFGTNHKVTPLEYTQNSMIGLINKVIRKDDFYYIMSGDYAGGKSIIKFSDRGKFVSKLNKLGRGGDEYLSIGDFDLLCKDGKTQLWICSDNKIMIYNADNYKLDHKIELPFFINKFKIISDDKILLMTSQNDESLTIIDMDGNIKEKYLSKYLPFLGMRPVQFVKIGDKYIFQLGQSADFVYYDCTENVFGNGKYFENDFALTQKELSDIYEQKGQGYISTVRDKTQVRNMRYFDDKVFFDILNAGNRYIVSYDTKNKKTMCCKFQPNPSLSFISYMIYSESDRGLIMLDYNDANQGKDENPKVIDFFL